MRKSDLIHRVAKIEQLQPSLVQTIVDVFLGQILDELSTGESVKLHGFGSFEVRCVEKRLWRTPEPGEVVATTQNKILFIPSSELKRRINLELS